jgi:hypothetical protein
MAGIPWTRCVLTGSKRDSPIRDLMSHRKSIWKISGINIGSDSTIISTILAQLRSHGWLKWAENENRAISNNIARERIRFYEESDAVIDDWRRLLPAEWVTKQAEQKHQWELDICGQRKCTWQHVLFVKEGAWAGGACEAREAARAGNWWMG